VLTSCQPLDHAVVAYGRSVTDLVISAVRVRLGLVAQLPTCAASLASRWYSWDSRCPFSACASLYDTVSALRVPSALELRHSETYCHIGTPHNKEKMKHLLTHLGHTWCQILLSYYLVSDLACPYLVSDLA
jgi:hypothetical protein